MPTLYLTVGLPASGKSTWAREQLTKDSNLVRVNKDDLREMLHGGSWNKANEKQVIRVRDAIVLDALRAGRNVVVDDTNLHPKHEARMKEILKIVEAEGIKVRFQKRDFTDVPLETCLERDRLRAKPVGDAVILGMHDSFLEKRVPLITVGDVPVWFTSDLHFGHQNILKYDSRPWQTVPDMNRGIIEAWNATVGPDDIVWVLGDVAMGKVDETLSLICNLNGRKYLVAGNHDRCWSGSKGGSGNWLQKYLDAGFESVVETAEVMLAGQRCWVSHFPYKGGGDHTAEERYSEHRLVNDGRWLIHGHVHSEWKTRDRMINVGIDAWNYSPVSSKTLEGIISGS